MTNKKTNIPQIPPVLYPYYNVHNALITPSTVHVQNTYVAAYFRRYLLQKAMSVYKWKLPVTWDEFYFLYNLYCFGYVCVINTDKFGIIPQWGTLEGFNVYYAPRAVRINNPLINYGNDVAVIGRDTELITLTPDYGGIYDLVCIYADQMAVAIETAGMNLFNSKLSYVFGVKDKAHAETLKEMYDRISSGEPAVFYGKDVLDINGVKPWDAFIQNVRQNFISPEVVDLIFILEQQFDSEIGIPAVNTGKKERLVTKEVSVGTVESSARADFWLSNLKKSIKKVQRMFGVTVSVEWRYPPNRADEECLVNQNDNVKRVR